MKQFAIIGIGNFGKYLATRLYEMGYEVLVIDKRPSAVQDIKDGVSQAVVGDATDRRTLEALDLKQLDAAVVSIGSAMSDSILATLNLIDIGIQRVMAKAISNEHGRILKKIGATDILFPERDLAISLAERLNNPNMIDYLPFLENYGIIELAPPKPFIGKALWELDLINRYGVQVIAIKEIVPERMNLVPTGKFVIKDSDILILLGPNEGLERLRED